VLCKQGRSAKVIAEKNDSRMAAALLGMYRLLHTLYIDINLILRTVHILHFSSYNYNSDVYLGKSE